MPRCKV